MIKHPNLPGIGHRSATLACILAMPLFLAACAPSGGDKARNAAVSASSSATALSATAAASLPAAASTTLAATAKAGWESFDSRQWGFRIDYPDTWRAGQSFGTSYFSTGTWKTYAASDSKGTPIVALTLPGSNKITTAQLRIGVSADAKAVAHCFDLPATAAGGGDHQMLNGVPFVHFRASDAGMSHYVNVESYRAVHADRCYAIDLWIAGTRPQVYSPPATPPFTQDQAEERLQSALHTFRFQP